MLMSFVFPLSSIDILPSAPISPASSLLHLLHFLISPPRSFSSCTVNPSFLFSTNIYSLQIMVLFIIRWMMFTEMVKNYFIHSNFFNTCLSFVLLAEKDITSPFLQLQRFIQSPFLDMAITPSLWPLWTVRDIYMPLINERDPYVWYKGHNELCSQIMLCGSFLFHYVLWAEVLMAFCLDYLFKDVVFLLIMSPLRAKLA